MQTQKVMVIGLDGATFDLMTPWLESGELPNLARIVQSGTHGELRSVTPPESPLAWPSFATGRNPGKHGVFGFYESHVSLPYSLSPINARTNRAETLYKTLAKAGKKVITLAVPFTFPPEPLENGIMIPGEFSLPGEVANRTASYPPGIQDEVSQVVADTRLAVDTSLVYQSPSEYLKDLHATTDNLLDMATYLLNNKPWDFFMLVFSGVDQVEHYFYRDLIEKGTFEDAILTYYRKVDEAVGVILQQVEKEEMTLFVMSDHGMQPFKQYFCLNLWLHEKGLLKFKQPIKQRLKQKLIQFMNKSGIKKLVLDNVNLRRFSSGAISSALSFHDIDFTRTQAYAYGFGSIRINLEGRDADGAVSLAEYDSVRELIMQGLEAEGADLKSYKREDVYQGPFVDRAPDLVVTSDRYWPNGLAGVGPFSNLYAAVLEDSPFINGMHAMNGIFMARGPHVQATHEIQGAELIDLAPTILYTMGLDIPVDMDGKLLGDIFDAEFFAAYPARYADTPEKPENETDDDRYIWSSDEEEALLNRLRDLGYLG